MDEWDRPERQPELPSKLFWWTLGRGRERVNPGELPTRPTLVGAIATTFVALAILGGAVIMWIFWVPALAAVVAMLGVVLLIAAILGMRESRWEGRIQDRR